MINMTIELMQDDIIETIITDIIEHNWSLSACKTMGYYEDIKNNILDTVDDTIYSDFNYYSEDLRTQVFDYLIDTDPERLTQMLDLTEFVKTLIDIYYEDCYDEAIKILEQEGYYSKELD